MWVVLCRQRPIIFCTMMTGGLYVLNRRWRNVLLPVKMGACACQQDECNFSWTFAQYLLCGMLVIV